MVVMMMMMIEIVVLMIMVMMRMFPSTASLVSGRKLRIWSPRGFGPALSGFGPPYLYIRGFGTPSKMSIFI